MKYMAFFSFLSVQYKKIRDYYYYSRRIFYIRKIKNILSSDTSIISSNCFAGRIMQDLKMPYNSPTLGLYFMYPDYIVFLENIEFYLKEAKITFVKNSKYPLGDERRINWKHWYPIGLLDNKVEIHFLHYHTEQEAAEKWHRRANRVNLNKLLVIGMEQNLCTELDILNFDKLPFPHKVMFSSKDIATASNVYMKEFKEKCEVGDPYKQGHVFYKYLVNFLNEKN